MGLRGKRSQPIALPPKPAPDRQPIGEIPALTEAEREWLLNGGPDECPFSSETACRLAWDIHRDELLHDCGTGYRPVAFWLLEQGGKRPPFERERSVLYERGLLSEAELTELTAHWRQAFNEAQRPGFYFIGDIIEGATVCAVYSGQRARCAHYQHHDIPRTLIEQWEAAQGRSARARSSPPRRMKSRAT